MEKIKIIDLLCMIANGEKNMPTIRYRTAFDSRITYYYDEETKNYYDENGNHELFSSYIGSYLKNEVEILEEDKKIEKLTMSRFTRNQKAIAKKVNEVIDYINKEEK